MRESLMYGSVRGARCNSRPYRDRPTSHRKKALDREDPLLYIALNNERAHK